MKKSSISLKSLHTFECAARHGSFTRAGEELFITQGAVSKQIKLIEESLNLVLFARRGPYLELTREGEMLLASVTTGLEIIDQGIAALRSKGDSRLTITLLPSFASNWLLPRLGRFEAQHPQLSIRLASSYLNVDFAVQTDIDAGIRLGNGKWPGLFVRQLTTDCMFPVCTPSIAMSVKEIDDLSDQIILVDSAPYDEWENWFRFLDRPYKVKGSKFFDDTHHQIRAAMEGLGVGLVREELVQEYLQSGVLVRLFDVEYFSELHYYFVFHNSRQHDESIILFGDWLTEQGSYSGLEDRVAGN